MTIPDDLTKAVADALRQLDEERRWSAPEGYEDDARIAVAAMLRALPESEAVREAVATRIQEAHHEAWTPGRPEDGPRLQTMTDIADVALAAIAKLADDE